MRGAALLLALAAGNCSCRGFHGPAAGPARPTLPDRTSGPYLDAASAQAAFTRTDGPLTAVLEDAAWIRLEADPSGAATRHPDYFAGWTTFQVVLETDGFVRPTDETYLLEDSLGRRVTARPDSYRGRLDERRRLHVASFTLTFAHALSKDVTWVRLLRQGDGGGAVRWDFE